jgi:outer membrane protein W
MKLKAIISSALVAVLLASTPSAYAQKPISVNNGGGFISYGAHRSTIEAGLNFSEGITVVLPQVRYRYFLSDRLAIRGTLNAATNSTVENVYSNPDNFDGKVGTRTVIDRSWGLQGGLEYHPSGAKRVSPYFGAVAGIGAGRGKELWKDYNQDAAGDGIYEFQTTASLNAPFFSYNFGAVAGVDIYLIENLYMGLELNWLMNVRNNRIVEFEIESLAGSAKVNLAPADRQVSTNFSALPTVRVGWRF